MANSLLIDKQDHICTITIDRPEARNSLSPEICLSLEETLNRLKGDSDIRVLVIRGAGEKAFSSGFDIGRIGARSQQMKDNEAVLDRTFGSVASYPYPVIAMIYGFAVGAALELVLNCDLRIAADDARLGITPAKLGVLYRHTGMRTFVEQIGITWTKELFFSGRLVSAQRALQMGLVNQIVPREELATVTYDLAREISENAPLSVSGTKTVLARLTRREQLSEKDAAEIQALADRVVASEDLMEGKKAFSEKRKPLFKGR